MRQTGLMGLVFLLIAGCASTDLVYEGKDLTLKTSQHDKHTVRVEFYEDGEVKSIETRRDDATSNDVLKTMVGFVGGILAQVGL